MEEIKGVLKINLDPTLISDVTVQLIKTNASDLDVARAAWVSTLGDDARERESNRVEGLINFLWKNQHTSPFEHGSFTFFVDCPIFVSREFMRHRTFSFNETSGRYRVLDGRFYVPGEVRPLIQIGKPGNYEFSQSTPEHYTNVVAAMHRAYEVCWREYEYMLSIGTAKEVARDVLPVGLYTQFYATCNPLNLMKFLGLRTSEDALYEIQSVARQMESCFETAMPLTYRAWKKNVYRSNDNSDTGVS